LIAECRASRSVIGMSIVVHDTPYSALSPYTTLFRSHGAPRGAGALVLRAARPARGQDAPGGAVPPDAPRHLAPAHLGRELGERRSEEHTSELQSLASVVWRVPPDALNEPNDVITDPS